MATILFWIKRLAIALVIFAALAILTLAISVERLSGGYVKLRPSGVYTSLRYMTDDKTKILLVGVAHVADQQFYDEVFEAIRRADSLVLAEGVTDKANMIKKKFSYEGFAKRLSLTEQSYLHDKFQVYGKIEPADIDVSDFDEATLSFIRALGAIMDRTATPEMELAFRESLKNPIILDQILNFRSQRLLAYFDQKHKESESIAIPWGAAHMREIEKGFGDRGFRLTDSSSLKVTGYAPLVKLIFGGGRLDQGQ